MSAPQPPNTTITSAPARRTTAAECSHRLGGATGVIVAAPGAGDGGKCSCQLGEGASDSAHTAPSKPPVAPNRLLLLAPPDGGTPSRSRIPPNTRPSARRPPYTSITSPTPPSDVPAGGRSLPAAPPPVVGLLVLPAVAFAAPAAGAAAAGPPREGSGAPPPAMRTTTAEWPSSGGGDRGGGGACEAAGAPLAAAAVAVPLGRAPVEAPGGGVAAPAFTPSASMKSRGAVGSSTAGRLAASTPAALCSSRPAASLSAGASSGHTRRHTRPFIG